MVWKVRAKRGFLICFTGIDGSGKTTLAKTLVEAMTKRGIKVKYVYGRYDDIMVKPFITVGRALFLKGKDASVDYADYSRAKRKAYQNRLFSAGYQYLLLFDYLFQLLVKVSFPLMLGRNIICDRYIYDTVVTDLAVDLGYSDEKLRSILRIYSGLLPKPDLVFLVDAPEEIAFQRKGDICSVEYLKERRKIYAELGEEYKMSILDSSRSLSELEATIGEKVLDYLGLNKTKNFR